MCEYNHYLSGILIFINVFEKYANVDNEDGLFDIEYIISNKTKMIKNLLSKIIDGSKLTHEEIYDTIALGIQLILENHFITNYPDAYKELENKRILSNLNRLFNLRREDRNGNHPTINYLGDYDVIGLNLTQKRIYVIECKVLQPVGSIFEQSNQQKLFFFKHKYDEKFQKRIDYFTSIATSFFANYGFETEGFVVQPYMVVNKVFSSYYKQVDFPIVTYGELKKELQS